MANLNGNPLGSANDLIDSNSAGIKTFTGADIVAYFNHKRVGSLQAVTVNITRETQPIYTLGSADVQAFAQGKRGIAGSLVFSQFDKDALTQDIFALDNANGAATTLFGMKFGEIFQTGTDLRKGLSSYDTPGSTAFSSYIMADLQATQDMVKDRRLRYADQIPPFNIVLTMVSPDGAASTVSIIGVQLVNQGWGYSLDDITNEVAYTFVCKEVTPLMNIVAYSGNIKASAMSPTGWWNLTGV